MKERFEVYFVTPVDDDEPQHVLIFFDGIDTAALYKTGTTYELELYPDDEAVRLIKIPLDAFSEAIEAAKQKFG
ncbi:MAG: hypothetical protein ACYC6A_23965 [Armatimonadota bacterium]